MFRTGYKVTWLGAAGFWLMYHVRLAGGRVTPEVQFMRRFSPTWYLSLPPMMLGPCRGTTTISRSPNLESVAKIGPSWLTLVLASIAARAGQAELAEFHLVDTGALHLD